MLEFEGKTMRAGETVYLRLRFLGVDTDVDGTVKAVCCPVDARGLADEDELWFFREALLVKAAVVADDIERRAREMKGKA